MDAPAPPPAVRASGRVVNEQTRSQGRHLLYDAIQTVWTRTNAPADDAGATSLAEVLEEALCTVAGSNVRLYRGGVNSATAALRNSPHVTKHLLQPVAEPQAIELLVHCFSATSGAFDTQAALKMISPAAAEPPRPVEEQPGPTPAPPPPETWTPPPAAPVRGPPTTTAASPVAPPPPLRGPPPPTQLPPTEAPMRSPPLPARMPSQEMGGGPPAPIGLLSQRSVSAEVARSVCSGIEPITEDVYRHVADKLSTNGEPIPMWLSAFEAANARTRLRRRSGFSTNSSMVMSPTGPPPLPPSASMAAALPIGVPPPTLPVAATFPTRAAPPEVLPECREVSPYKPEVTPIRGGGPLAERVAALERQMEGSQRETQVVSDALNALADAANAMTAAYRQQARLTHTLEQSLTTLIEEQRQAFAAEQASLEERRRLTQQANEERTEILLSRLNALETSMSQSVAESQRIMSTLVTEGPSAKLIAALKEAFQEQAAPVISTTEVVASQQRLEQALHETEAVPEEMFAQHVIEQHIQETVQQVSEDMQQSPREKEEEEEERENYAELVPDAATLFQPYIAQIDKWAEIRPETPTTEEETKSQVPTAVSQPRGVPIPETLAESEAPSVEDTEVARPPEVPKPEQVSTPSAAGAPLREEVPVPTAEAGYIWGERSPSTGTPVAAPAPHPPVAYGPTGAAYPPTGVPYPPPAVSYRPTGVPYPPRGVQYPPPPGPSYLPEGVPYRAPSVVSEEGEPKLQYLPPTTPQAMRPPSMPAGPASQPVFPRSQYPPPPLPILRPSAPPTPSKLPERGYSNGIVAEAPQQFLIFSAQPGAASPYMPPQPSSSLGPPLPPPQAGAAAAGPPPPLSSAASLPPQPMAPASTGMPPHPPIPSPSPALVTAQSPYPGARGGGKSLSTLFGNAEDEFDSLFSKS